jgi:hypothetical protein
VENSNAAFARAASSSGFVAEAKAMTKEIFP